MLFLFTIHFDVHPHFQSMGDVKAAALHVSLAGGVGDGEGDDMTAAERGCKRHAGIDQRRLTSSPSEFRLRGSVSEIADVVGDGEKPGGDGLVVNFREKAMGVGVLEAGQKLTPQEFARFGWIGQSRRVRGAEQFRFIR